MSNAKPPGSPSISDRVLRALRREGGRASAAYLGRLTGRGHRINSTLLQMAGKGLVSKTAEKDGVSPIWELVVSDG